MAITGGIESTYTDGGTTYKVHKFLSSDPVGLTVTDANATVDLLIVAGGGGGGGGKNGGGGGGAGGVRVELGVVLTPGTYAVVVGEGGAGGTVAQPNGSEGSSSSINGLLAVGGGGGGGWKQSGSSGGSGGGSGRDASRLEGGGETGGQGNKGGGSEAGAWSDGGGGGGAGAVGGNGSGGTQENARAGSGGIGVEHNFTGTPMYYGGGGGGASQDHTGGLGGLGGGGRGCGKAPEYPDPGATSYLPLAGTPNTGGGGGGGQVGGGHNNNGEPGGSGIVIVRYATEEAPPGPDPDPVDGDYSYKLHNNQVTITGYAGSGQNLTLPATILDKPVVAVGPRAFFHNRNLVSIVFPATLRGISEEAFAACINLISLTFLGPPPTLGRDVFFYMNNPLTRVYYMYGQPGWGTTFAERPDMRNENKTLTFPVVCANPPPIKKSDMAVSGSVVARDFRGVGTYLTGLPFIPQCMVEIPRIKGTSWDGDPIPIYKGSPYVYAYFGASPSLDFLNYNPEIWLFRYRPARWSNRRGWAQEKVYRSVMKARKFRHPIHLGEKVAPPHTPGSHLYHGKDDLGIESEWPILPVDRREYRKIGLDFRPHKLFCTVDESTTFPFEYSNQDHRLKGSRKGSRACRAVLRFAIVIDNPDPRSNNRKIIGPMSDEVVIRFSLYHKSEPRIAIGWKFYTGGASLKN